MPYSVHFFLFMARIIHGTTSCDKYKSSKVAYIAAYIEISWETKDILTNFSQFRFPDYRSGNIPLHWKLIWSIQLQKILAEDKSTIKKLYLFIADQKRKYHKISLKSKKKYVNMLWMCHNANKSYFPF